VLGIDLGEIRQCQKFRKSSNVYSSKCVPGKTGIREGNWYAKNKVSSMRVTDTARKPVIHGADLVLLKDAMAMLAKHSRQKELCRNTGSLRAGSEGRMEQDHSGLRV
jgi:hypothetical protein